MHNTFPFCDVISEADSSFPEINNDITRPNARDNNDI